MAKEEIVSLWSLVLHGEELSISQLSQEMLTRNATVTSNCVIKEQAGGLVDGQRWL